MTFKEHVQSGATTLCRCWGIFRKDDVFQGFTDHDCDIVFDGLTFAATSGMTPHAIESSTGLSVDNSLAIGVLSNGAINETDLKLGRYDGAGVKIWRVNWADFAARKLDFSGEIGEIRLVGNRFEAELRGQAERLNIPTGRLFQKQCDASLGDGTCGVDLADENFSVEVTIDDVLGRSGFAFDELLNFEPGWFERGVIEFLDGVATGVTRGIKVDTFETGNRRLVRVWDDLPVDIAAGTLVRLVAGCDKRWKTCAAKFDNILNFRGFPDIPGEDWLTKVPRSSDTNSGGSLR